MHVIYKLMSIFLFLIFYNYADAQKLENYTLEKVMQGISVPDSGSDEYYLKIKDTTLKVLTLVLELQFDDSIVISVNDSICVKSRIKTNPVFSRVPEPIDIDYGNYNLIPEITLILVEKRKFIRFKPLPGYRILYINRSSKEWFLDFSNYGRTYY
jgi:hypothetical protein